VAKRTPKNQKQLDELSKLVDEMLYRLCKLELRDKDARDAQEHRTAAIETRIAEMNEAFSNARFPRAPVPTLTDAVQ
jgi:hypothetical protein